MKKFAVFDIDGTLIRWQLYHALSDALVDLGSIDTKAFAPVKAARMRWKQRKHQESYIEYEHRLVETFNMLLTDLRVEDFETAAEKVFSEYKDQVYTYTRALLKDLKKQGYMLFAISGSPKVIVEKVANYYGFNEFVGSEFESKNGKFTGNRVTPFGRKHEIIQDLMKKHRLGLKGSMAVGDSEGDISMLEIVEKPIAFNPSQKLLEIAKSKGWDVVVERKNVVYKLEAENGRYLLV